MSAPYPIPFENGLDVQGSEINSLRVENRTTTLSTPLEGMVYYDSNTGVKKFRYVVDAAGATDADKYRYIPRFDEDDTYTGALTFNRGSSTPPFVVSATLPSTGSTATMVSNLNVQYISGYAASQSTTANTVAIRNSDGTLTVQDPVAATDAVNFRTAQAMMRDQDRKQSVRVGTTTALPTNTRSGNVLTASSNGAFPTVDGISLSAGEDILVMHEGGGGSAYTGTANANNGIYVVTSLGSVGTPWVLTRRSDADADSEVTTGMMCAISEGTQNLNSEWTMITDDPITLNTTAIQFTKTGGNTLYVAGNGIVISGASIHFCTSSGYTQGDLFYASNSTTVARITAVAAGKVLASTGVSSAPAYSYLMLSGGSTMIDASTSGQLPIANGGTNSSAALSNGRVIISSGGSIVERAAITANALTVGDATNGLAPLALGTAKYILGMNAGGSANEYKALTVTSGGVIDGGTWQATAIGTLYGGTGADLSGVATGGLIYKTATTLSGSAALTGVVIGNGTSAPTAITGTAGTHVKWGTAGATLANSIVTESGSTVSVAGAVSLTGDISFASTNPQINLIGGSGRLRIYGATSGAGVITLNETTGTTFGGVYIASAGTGGAQLNVLSTTGAQLGLNYDANNLLKVTVSSAGVATFAPGTGTLGGTATSISITGGLTVSASVTLSALTASKVVFTDGSKILTSSGTVGVDQGGTGIATVAQGDVFYGSASNTIAALAKSTTANSYLKNSGTSNNPAWSTIAASDIVSGAALTRVDDTNVTLTLGGTPSTALLVAASITVGWSGQLSIARGGTGAATATAAFDALSPMTTLGDIIYGGASGTRTRLAGNTTTAKQWLSQTGNGSVSAAPAWSAITAADVTSGAALTRVDDTNVTLTLGGSPTTALLVAASITVGWTGTLSVSRGGTGVGTLASNGVLYGNGTGAVLALAVNSTGTNKFLTQSSSAAPAWATIVAGDISGLAVTWTAAHVFQSASIGTTQDDAKGVALITSTAASAGAQQYSPALRWRGFGWKTNATAASEAVDFRAYVVPVQGAAHPSGKWTLDAAINGGSYATAATIDDSGTLTLTAGIVCTYITASAAVTLSSMSASKVVFTDGSKALTSSGTVEVIQGGTGQNSALTANRLIYASSTTAMACTAYSVPTSFAANDLIYGSATNTLTALAAVASRILATDGSGNVAWRNDIPSGTTIGSEALCRVKVFTLSTSATSYTKTHSWNTQSVWAVLRERTTNIITHVQVEATDANNVIIRFTNAPTSNKYDLIVFG